MQAEQAVAELYISQLATADVTAEQAPEETKNPEAHSVHEVLVEPEYLIQLFITFVGLKVQTGGLALFK